MKDTTKLYDLPKGELQHGSRISNALCEAGYVESAEKVIGRLGAWSMTVGAFLEMIQQEDQD